MTQNVVDFSDNPTGAGLMDDYLGKDQQNVLTSNSGIQRPSYAVAGTKWLDTSATPWVLKMYDGTNDVALGTVNPSTHAFIPYGVDSKQDIANLSQTLDTSTTKYPSNKAVKTAIVNKANTSLSNVDSNIDYVVESYQNGFNWYRVYKSGWIEQGGYHTFSSNTWEAVTLLKPMKNNRYMALLTGTGTAETLKGWKVGSEKKNTSTTLYAICANEYGVRWYVSGQGA